MKTLRGFLCFGLMAMFSLSSLPVSTAETFRPVVRGKRGAVAAGHPLSAEAGLRLLQQGGNAIDAGCAAVLAASVIEFSHFSFGGEVPIIIKPASGRPSVINGQGSAPKLATPEFFTERAKSAKPSADASKEDKGVDYTTAGTYVSIPSGGTRPGLIPSSGILPATVPAVLDAVVVALDRFGTKSLQEVMQPAIELADGFPLDETRVNYIERTRKVMERWPSSAKVFLPSGQVPKVGQVFSQPDLARTLREIVKAERRAAPQGRRAGLVAARDFFYKGPVARQVSDFSEANGGLIRASDFASFKAKVEEPAKAEYRGYEVYKTGFWAQGPVMLQTLNILEGYDIRAMRHNSSDYIHTLTEAMKLGFADRDRYYGDPDFVRVPERALLSKEYAAARRSLIEAARASMAQRPGDPVNGKPLSDAPAESPRTGESSVPEVERANDTTCVNVIDKDGNLFSATPSGAWLPAVVAGDTGILMGQRMQSFLLEPGHPNVLAPGKRPRVTLTPTLVLKDGKPFLVLSTPGGDNQDQTLLQVLLNIVEFGMNVQEAVEAPRFQTLHFVSSFDDHRFNPGVLTVEDRIAKDVAAELTSRGHKVETQGAWGNPSAPTVILLRPDSGVIEAGADPRRGRYALAW
ncbi:MAG TPA: gamma-glutamyltransferase family protein [Blastocatellia bacterium]|nr:gamma-glutamyltransferase family protein [Blastocatellia bacterium]